MTPRLVALGDNVVDCYPELGYMYPGGNAVNVAVHAARQGIPAAYIGAVGTDSAGQTVLAALRAEGVDTSGVMVREGQNAWASIKVVNGNRVFGKGEVGVSCFEPTPAHLAMAAAADIVHTGECSMLEEHLPALRQVAPRLSFDFSERPWDYIALHAPLMDIAICSQPDVDRDEAETRAAKVAALGPSLVLVTLGAGGAVLHHDGRVDAVPAVEHEVVDTLGAGDATIARFLAGLILGEAPLVALQESMAYAALACREYGAFGYRTPLDVAIPTNESSKATPLEGHSSSGMPASETGVTR